MGIVAVAVTDLVVGRRDIINQDWNGDESGI